MHNLLLILLRTFIDIIALRKGPDSVPKSWLVFALSLLLMVVSTYAAVMLVGVEEGRNLPMTFFSYALGVFFYAAVILLSGHAERMLQAISCIIACGSIITVFFVAAFTLLGPVFGREFAAVVATLIVFWSVPVEGHIMARAIGQHWYVGIGIAIAAFVLQLGLQSVYTPAQ